MKRYLKPLFTVLALAVIIILVMNQPSKGGGIPVEEAQKLIASDTSIVVLDVRTPGEYHGNLGHIRNSILIPVQQLESRMNELEQYKERKIVVVCRTDNRSGVARDMLTKQGFTAVNILGGMVKWNSKGYAVER